MYMVLSAHGRMNNSGPGVHNSQPTRKGITHYKIDNLHFPFTHFADNLDLKYLIKFF